MKISYDSEKLINELKEDINEFGIDEKFYAMYETFDGIDFITNYDFISDIELTDKEKKEYSKIEIMQADELLEKLEKQNNILN